MASLEDTLHDEVDELESYRPRVQSLVEQSREALRRSMVSVVSGQMSLEEAIAVSVLVVESGLDQLTTDALRNAAKWAAKRRQAS